MKVGHIFLEGDADDRMARVVELIESLDRLAVDQHVLTASPATARRLGRCPYVTVGPIVRSPIMACCLMPVVDLVHTHDPRSGQAGLLLALTRSIPYVLSNGSGRRARSLQQSVLHRAQAQLAPDYSDPEIVLSAYRDAVGNRSELPKHSNGRQ